MKHLPNAFSYLQKGLRDVTGAIDQYNNMKSIFDTENTEMGTDAIASDSIFQNEEIKFRLNSKDYLKHVVPRFWGGHGQKEPLPMYYPLEVQVKRKDSLLIVLKHRKATDSIERAEGLK